MDKKFNYRYFNNENENPFDPNNDFTKFVFWNHEKLHSELNSDEQDKFIKILKQMINEGAVSGILLDDKYSLNNRSVECFAELRFSKFCPMDFERVDWQSYFD